MGEGGRDDGELIKSCSKREKRFDALLLYVYAHAACVNRKWRPEKKSTCGTCIRKIMGCTGSRKPPSPRNANREIVSSATCWHVNICAQFPIQLLTKERRETREGIIGSTFAEST